MIDTTVLTNADIQARLDLLKCCIAQSGVSLSNKLKIGQVNILFTSKVYFATAFLDLFCDYSIVEAVNGIGFIDNTCICIEEMYKITDMINDSCICDVCFDPEGTYTTGESYDGSFD